MGALQLTLIISLCLLIQTVRSSRESPYIDTCEKISKCLAYYEGDCDSQGKRQVCITSYPLKDCVKTGRFSTIQGACKEDDHMSLRAERDPGMGIVTKPWPQNRPLCMTQVEGGSKVSFGIREPINVNDTSSPQPALTILGSENPVECSEYASVCEHRSNREMRLTFTVGACPANCTCGNWEDKGECSVTCGSGKRLVEQTCTGSGCIHPLTRTKQTVCTNPDCSLAMANFVQRSSTVDGNWSEWSEPSPCSVSCGEGVSVRTRSCTNPIPQHCGRGCEGKSYKKTVCNAKNCPPCNRLDPFSIHNGKK